MTKYKKSFNERIVYSNKNFQKILSFYLFGCPVPGTSSRGKTFYDYGWQGSASFGKFKKKMLEAASSGNLKEHYYPCKKDDLEKHFGIVELLEPPFEYCVFLQYEEKLVMQSLYSAIRNAFAHGSFNISSYNKIRIYYFENYKGYMKAKIALREQTLLDWINIVEKGNDVG